MSPLSVTTSLSHPASASNLMHTADPDQQAPMNALEPCSSLASQSATPWHSTARTRSASPPKPPPSTLHNQGAAAALHSSAQLCDSSGDHLLMHQQDEGRGNKAHACATDACECVLTVAAAPRGRRRRARPLDIDAHVSINVQVSRY